MSWARTYNMANTSSIAHPSHVAMHDASTPELKLLSSTWSWQPINQLLQYLLYVCIIVLSFLMLYIVLCQLDSHPASNGKLTWEAGILARIRSMHAQLLLSCRRSCMATGFKVSWAITHSQKMFGFYSSWAQCIYVTGSERETYILFLLTWFVDPIPLQFTW